MKKSKEKETSNKPVSVKKANKDAALEAFLSKMQKKAEKEGRECTITKGTDIKPVEFYSTGILGMDICMGGGALGGVAKGRLVGFSGPESSGKSTLALHVIAEAMKNDPELRAYYLDAEETYDAKYAESLGVDQSRIVVDADNNAEAALTNMRDAIATGLFKLAVIDSTNALCPTKDLEGDVSGATMGSLARVLSVGYRQLCGVAKRNNCSVMVIEQVRSSIGGYGCLHGFTVIPFTDGRSYTIKEIVENKIKGKVWSYNEKTKKLEEKEIIDWHFNGKVESNKDYLQIVSECPTDDHKGFSSITVTKNHQLLTDKGWIEAGKLTKNHKLVTKYKSIVNGTFADFLYGTAIGDSHLVSVSNKKICSFRFQDKTNPEYLKWKISKMSSCLNFNENNNVYDSEFSIEFGDIYKELDYNRNPLYMLKNHYSDLGMAVWFMDDGFCDVKREVYRGCISIKRYKNNSKILNEISKYIELKTGVKGKINLKNGSIWFDKDNIDILFNRIAKYFPNPMQYKLPAKFKNKYKDFKLSNTVEIKERQSIIKSIKIAPASYTRVETTKGKYDITVKDNHNYMAGGRNSGVIVHNSPEVTTVGNAGKFFMSQRVILRRQTKKNEENGVAVSNEVKVSVIKNKVGIPYRTHSLLCVYGKGFDQEEDIINLSTSLDIVTHSGAWYYYPDKATCKEEHKWNGKEEYRDYLLAHPEFKKEIFEKVNKAYINADKTTVLQDEDSAALKKQAEEENAKAVKELQEQGIDISEVQAEVDE